MDRIELLCGKLWHDWAPKTLTLFYKVYNSVKQSVNASITFVKRESRI